MCFQLCLVSVPVTAQISYLSRVSYDGHTASQSPVFFYPDSSTNPAFDSEQFTDSALISIPKTINATQITFQSHPISQSALLLDILEEDVK